MGLNSRVFKLMTDYAKSGGKALAAGYPDMLVTQQDLLDAGISPEVIIPADEDSEKIVREHGVNIPCAYDAKSVFTALNYDLDVVDINVSRSGERYTDLNYPHHIGSYDLVLDHGTIEHCFNIAQAAINLAEAVKEGGIIVQHLPMTMLNHGFYNINPTWFHALYSADNGFELLHLEVMAGDKHSQGVVPAHNHFVVNTTSSLLTCVARRIEQKKILYPTQEKYK